MKNELKKYLSDDQIEVIADIYENNCELLFNDEAMVLKELDDKGYHSLKYMMAHAYICGAKFSRNFLSSINLEN
jgi:hypothetical protein